MPVAPWAVAAPDGASVCGSESSRWRTVWSVLDASGARRPVLVRCERAFELTYRCCWMCTAPTVGHPRRCPQLGERIETIQATRCRPHRQRRTRTPGCTGPSTGLSTSTSLSHGWADDPDMPRGLVTRNCVWIWLSLRSFTHAKTLPRRVPKKSHCARSGRQTDHHCRR